MRVAKSWGVLGLLTAQLAIATAPAHAGYVQVSLDGLPNADLRTYTGGTNFPAAPTTLTVGGVDFNLTTLGSTPNTLGILQTSPNGPTFDIHTSVFGATTVYTLMNSAFGVFGADIASVEFKGAGGSDQTFQLVEGTNIRDHFNGDFNNTIAQGTPTASFGSDRLDLQTFSLMSSFATDTLTDIILTATASSGNPNGEAFLAAATVETASAPEPASLTLFGVAALSLTSCIWLRRRKAEAHAA